MRRYIAELAGTYWLVFGGCGSALIAANFPELGIGFTGVSLAFGLTVLTMCYAIGHISGCHLNPAVTIGLAIGDRMDRQDVFPYIVAQITGAILAAWTLFIILSGHPDFSHENFAANGYGTHSPGGFDLTSAFITEFVLTGFFIFIIMGATAQKAVKGFAGITIGLALTLIHLISIPVTNTSVNPARSLSQALFSDKWALNQLWLFWIAPIAGAIIAALIYKKLYPNKTS